VSSSATTAEEAPQEASGLLGRLLAGIERVGNKVPHPALLFLGLCIGTILLSAVLAWIGVGATYEVAVPPDQTVEAVDVAGSVAPAEVMPSEQPDASE